MMTSRGNDRSSTASQLAASPVRPMQTISLLDDILLGMDRTMGSCRQKVVPKVPMAQKKGKRKPEPSLSELQEQLDRQRGPQHDPDGILPPCSNERRRQKMLAAALRSSEVKLRQNPYYPPVSTEQMPEHIQELFRDLLVPPDGTGCLPKYI